MFVSVRDIVFAKGRVALVASVVALITILLIMLSGLTNGLGKQNTAALETLDAQRIVFGPAEGTEEMPSFTTSQITQEQLDAWTAEPAVEHAEPLVVTLTQVGSDSKVTTGAVMGLPQDSMFAQKVDLLEGQHRPDDGQIVLSESYTEDLGIGLGDTVGIGGKDLEVVGFVADEFYSHLPVAWLTDADALAVAHQPSATVGTEIMVQFADGTDSAQMDEIATNLDGRVDTMTQTTRESFQAIPSYSSENGSLMLMQAFLYGISALVVISFITVWTVQRTRDVAVLRALGASRGYLVRDSLVQATLVVGLGMIIGALMGGLMGWLVATQVTAVPFLFSLAAVAIPALGVLLLGIVGSLLAVRRVAKVDPMIALGGN